MQSVTSATAVATTARANNITLFASLELSKSKWVVTINSPGSEKFSKHVVEGGDGAGLLGLLSRSRARAEQRYGVQVKAIVIQEAGLDGFWVHRLLLANGIESHVVDAASIAVDRRHRRAKTDAIDGETLLRTLMAWARSERRVCSMVRAPSPEDEDRRRLTRERGTLLKERIQHTNRVRGLLSGQGVGDYNPLRRDRFEQLEALRTGDGRELPPMLKAEIRRELDRIALVTTQLAAVERARDALIRTDAEERNNPAALLGAGISKGAGESPTPPRNRNRQALQWCQKICAACTPLGCRAHVCLAQPLSKARQKLGKSQSKSACILAPRFNPPHEKLCNPATAPISVPFGIKSDALSARIASSIAGLVAPSRTHSA